MKYRKKPIVVDAIRFTKELKADELYEFMQSADFEVTPNTKSIYINARGGILRAALGDFLIRGIQGEVYPCKADIFEATYDPA